VVDAVVGLRGTFAPAAGASRLEPGGAWRLAGLHGAPWGVCDYADDLETAGSDALRSWLHVNGAPTGAAVERLPTVMLALVLADALAASGTFGLSGLDAVLPLATDFRPGGDAGGSPALYPARIDPGHAAHRDVIIQVVPDAYASIPTTRPKAAWFAVIHRLTERLELESTGPCEPIRVHEGPFGCAYDDPPRVRVRLSRLSPGLLAWLAEATAAAAEGEGLTGRALVSLRVRDDSGGCSA
jgi:hypothetical protein